MKSEFIYKDDETILEMEENFDSLRFSTQGTLETNASYYVITPDNAREIIKVMEAIIKGEKNV
jgi:hypothetical protein